MLNMKKNTGLKISALIGSALALGTIFGLVSRNTPQTVADTAATGAQSQPAASVLASASAPQQPTQSQQQSVPAPAPQPRAMRPMHTRTHSS